jgi:hypothetical protein
MNRLAPIQRLTAKLWGTAFLLLLTYFLAAQKTITGKITDSKNQPLADQRLP